MAPIVRNLLKAEEETFDLAIIGGGIYGAMLAFESTRRGLHPLLLERDDFGEHTSANSLRIIHGGLRYLQGLHLHRYKESVAERRWFLANLPSLVTPLSCLMPLYGRGLRRPAVFRAAMYADGLLSSTRNLGVGPSHHLPVGHLIDTRQTREAFPSVDPQGLQGGAIWNDAFAQDSQRLIMETLRWASGRGATVLNYVEAHRLNTLNGRVVGIVGVDRKSGNHHEFRTHLVVNTAGPWSRTVSSCLDRDHPALFNALLAWNVVIDRKPLSVHALAVSPPRPDARTYFMVPWKEKIFVGTGYTSWNEPVAKRPLPTRKQVQHMLDDLNAAVPELCLNMDEILRITPGLVPASHAGGWKPAVRAVHINHGAAGGIQGLHSLSGVKLTTARHIAESALNRIFPATNRLRISRNRSSTGPHISDTELRILRAQWPPAASSTEWQSEIRSIADEESVLHLDDLMLRRLPLGDDPARDLEHAPVICRILGWGEDRTQREILRLRSALLTVDMLDAG